MTKKIKLMLEYECYPIWMSVDGGIHKNIDPSTLPIDASLLSKIQKWDSSFEAGYNPNDPAVPKGTASTDLDLEGFGIEIWISMQNALPDYNITYVSQIDGKEYSYLSDLEH